MLKYRRTWLGVAVLVVAFVIGLVPGDSVAKINKNNNSRIIGTNSQRIAVRVSSRVDFQRPVAGSYTGFGAVLVPQGTTNAASTTQLDNDGAPVPSVPSAPAAAAAQAFSAAPEGKVWIGFARTANIPGGGGQYGGSMQFQFDLPPSGPGLQPGDVYCVYSGIPGNAQDLECVAVPVPSLTAPFIGLLIAALLGSGMLVLRARRRSRTA